MKLFVLAEYKIPGSKKAQAIMNGPKSGAVHALAISVLKIFT